MFPEWLLKLQIITGEDVPFRATYARIEIIRRVQVERRSFPWRRRKRKMDLNWDAPLGAGNCEWKVMLVHFVSWPPNLMVWLSLNIHMTISTSRQVEPKRTFTKENILLGSMTSSQNKKNKNKQTKMGGRKVSPSFIGNLAKFVQMASGLVRTTDSAYRALCLFSILWFSLIWQTLLDSTLQNRNKREQNGFPSNGLIIPRMPNQ